MQEDGFKGKLGEVFVIQTQGKLPYRKVFVVGLGKEKKQSAYDWQYVYASIARCAKTNKASSLLFQRMIPTTRLWAWNLGAYSFLVHKNKETQRRT